MIRTAECYVCEIARADMPIVTPILKLGGRPVFVSHVESPVCAHCGQSMDFLGQIPLKVSLAFAGRPSMAYVFMCPGRRDSRGWLECHTWEPHSDANAVILQLDRGQKLVPESAPRYPDYYLHLKLTREPIIDTSDFAISEDQLEQVSQSTKIGGVPAWIQNNETPNCPQCHEPMAFVAQFDAGLDGELPADMGLWSQYNFFDFGDSGVGYVFVCLNECTDRGAFIWQCS